MVVADERLETLLGAFVSVADGLDLDDTLRRVVSAAVSLVNARYGALGVIGEHGGLSSFIHVGIDDDRAGQIGPLPTGRGLLGQLITEPRPLRMDDLHSHPQSVGFPSGHPEMTSFLGVPIRVRGGVFGNLYLTDKRDGQFTSEDVQLTVALAAAAGVAIQNSNLFDRNRRRQRWQRAVSAVQALVLSGAPESAVFAEVARRLRLLTGASVAVVAQPTTGVSVGATTAGLEVTYIAEPGALGGLVVGAAVAEDSAVGRAFSSGAAVSGSHGLVDAALVDGPTLALPLRSGQWSAGAFGLARPAGGSSFSADEIELCEVLAVQTALAVSYVAERRERERLAVFEERDRIARDLHDLVIQRIFAAGMMLEGVRRTAELPAPAAARLERAVDELDATVKEIRTTIFELHSPRDDGLRARVVEEVDRSEQAGSGRPSLTFTGPVDAVVSDAVADHVVAVVREGLSNAGRHAAGVRCAVAVAVDAQRVSVTVADEGPGLPDTGVARRSGLANLAERAAAVGGGCELTSRPGGGTQLQWWAPLPQG